MAEVMYAILRANGPFMAVYDIGTDSVGAIPVGAIVGADVTITLPIQFGGVPLCVFLTPLMGTDMYAHRWTITEISATQIVVTRINVQAADGLHARLEASLPHSHNADALGVVIP